MIDFIDELQYNAKCTGVNGTDFGGGLATLQWLSV